MAITSTELSTTRKNSREHLFSKGLDLFLCCLKAAFLYPKCRSWRGKKLTLSKSEATIDASYVQHKDPQNMTPPTKNVLRCQSLADWKPWLLESSAKSEATINSYIKEMLRNNSGLNILKYCLDSLPWTIYTTYIRKWTQNRCNATKIYRLTFLII